MGMYDVQPTISNMLGFYNKYSLGHDIFEIKDNNIVVFPNGNWLTNKVYYNSQKFRSYHSKLIETKSTFVYPSLHISIPSFIFNKTPLRDIFSRMLYGNLYFRREAKGLPFLHPINQALDTM